MVVPRKMLSLSLLLFGLTSCVGVGPTGERVVVINLAPSPCKAAEQYARTGEVSGEKADVKVKAGITAQELVKYRDRVALLEKQSAQACDLFNRGRTTFDQYQSEMRDVRTELSKIKSEVAE